MLGKIKAWFWGWPDGLVWRLTEGFTLRSRQKKFMLFMDMVNPASGDTILDVGVSNNCGRATNFLELWYPHRQNITALGVGLEDYYRDFKKVFPDVKLVIGDGRRLDFPDDSFDIVFSNAVVEHVGDRQRQRAFINELVRVGKKAYITSPNRWFPMESHTMIPLAHYLPIGIRYRIYRLLGRSDWADVDRLNLLSASEFYGLFPDGVMLRKVRLRTFGITHGMVAVAAKKR